MKIDAPGMVVELRELIAEGAQNSQFRRYLIKFKGGMSCQTR